VNKGSDTSSGTASEDSSRVSSPTHSEKANPPLYDPDVPLGPLHGWVCKRHNKNASAFGSQWAKRYFVVDDTRGTLSYMKTEYSKQASVVLPIVDISSVAEIQGGIVGDLRNCFRVSCPPVHLTLQAEDNEDCMMWVRGLERRTIIWKQKQQAGGYTIAEVASKPDSTTRMPMVPRDSLKPRDPQVARNTSEMNLAPLAAPVDNFNHTWVKEDEVGAHEFYPDRAQPFKSPVPEDKEGATSLVETVELFSDDDDDADRAPLPVADHDRRMTVKVSNSPPNGSVLARDGARDLASMLSSDEEEEEDELPPRRAATATARCAPVACTETAASLRSSLQDCLHNIVSEPSPPSSPLPSPASFAPVGGASGSSAAASWLTGLPDMVTGGATPGASPPLRAAPMPIDVVAPAADAPTPEPTAAGPSMQASPDDLDDDWDAPSPDVAPMPTAAHIGDGIAVDANFADDDWDDDDE